MANGLEQLNGKLPILALNFFEGFMIDLYKIYKGFYSRARQGYGSEQREIMADISHRLTRSMYMARVGRVDYEIALREAVALADELDNLVEKDDFSIRKYYAHNHSRALESGAFEINVPYPVRSRWDYELSEGCIYVSTADARPGLCKLGATTIDLKKRSHFTPGVIFTLLISNLVSELKIHFVLRRKLRAISQNFELPEMFRANRTDGMRSTLRI